MVKNKDSGGVIYKTTNLINNKFYIGKDKNNNPRYLGSGTVLKKAIEKYGIYNFEKEILAEAYSNAELNDLEKKYIKEYDAVNDKNSYNIAEGGHGGNTIAGFTKEEKQEFAEGIKNRWKNYTEEKRLEISQAISDKLKNKAKTEEHKEALYNSKKEYYETEKGIEQAKARGKKLAEFYKTEEGEIAKENLRQKCPHYGSDNGFYNKKHTKESRQKNRDAHLVKPSANKGKKIHSEDSKEKNRQAHLGKPSKSKGKKIHTEESKRRNREAHLGKNLGERKSTKIIRLQVYKDFNDGLSIQDLSKKYNVGVGAIYNYISNSKSTED